MKVIVALCCLFAVGAYAKTMHEVAECFRGQLRECKDKCKSDASIPEEKRQAVGTCWRAEIDSSRAAMKTCLLGKGIDSHTTNCFKSEHAHAHLKGMANLGSKFSEPVREAMKNFNVCYKQCIEEKQAAVEGCQEGCGEGDEATKGKLRECISEAKERFPSETLKSCMNTALGL